MKLPYTCYGLRSPHMTRVNIIAIDFPALEVISEDMERIPIGEMRGIIISNGGRINPDYK